MEDVELGCDEYGDCVYWSPSRGSIYGINKEGYPIDTRDIPHLLKKLGYKVSKSGGQLSISGFKD